MNNYNLSLFWNLGEEDTRPLCRHPSACPTGSCRKGGWPGGLKYRENEEVGEEKKEDDDVEEEMEEKSRDEKDIKDSLVVQEGLIVKFPLVPVATFAAPASRFFPARRC